MAVTLADLESRLITRLGFDVVSNLEAARVRESLNAAISAKSSDHIPGITSVYGAQTRATVSLTVSAHSANSSAITFSTSLASLGIFPGDWLEDSAGTEYVVHTVNEDDDIIDIGSPSASAISGTMTCHRRSVELAHAGPIFQVRDETSAHMLDAAPGAQTYFGFEVGAPVHFYQGWSELQGKSYLAVFPSPDAARHLLVTQSTFREELGSATEFNLPEPALNAIVEAARKIHVGWSGSVSPVEAQLAMDADDDFSDGLKNSGRQRSVQRRR